MRLGGWESLDMVLRYTKSMKFEERLRVLREMGKCNDFQLMSQLLQIIDAHWCLS